MAGLVSIGQPLKERNHNGFKAGQEEPFCPVVVSGLREKGAEIRDAYCAKGIPCVVVDYGYLSRVSGIADFDAKYWQVGIDRLGWVPPFQCSPDRLDALSIKMKSRKRRGDRVYVCGQHEGDPSHGLDRNGIERWASEKIKRLSMVTDREIVWRPHPDSIIDLPGIEASTGPIDWDDVFCIVTINSNIGHEAIVEGVPVVCQDSAPYTALAHEAFTEGLRVPSTKERRKYFSRLAYGQWTLDEMEQGKPQEWLIQNGLTRKRN